VSAIKFCTVSLAARLVTSMLRLRQPSRDKSAGRFWVQILNVFQEFVPHALNKVKQSVDLVFLIGMQGACTEGMSSRMYSCLSSGKWCKRVHVLTLLHNVCKLNFAHHVPFRGSFSGKWASLKTDNFKVGPLE
jgi:hypothetical protein